MAVLHGNHARTLWAWKDVGCCATVGPCTAGITSSESVVMKEYYTYFIVKQRRVRKRKVRDKGSHIRTMPNEER